MYRRWLSLALLLSSVSAFYPYGSGDGDEDKRSLPLEIEARGVDASGGITLDIKRMRVGLANAGYPSSTDTLLDEERQFLHGGQIRQPYCSQCYGDRLRWFRLYLLLSHEVWIFGPGDVHANRLGVGEHMGDGFELSIKCMFDTQHLRQCRIQHY